MCDCRRLFHRGCDLLAEHLHRGDRTGQGRRSRARSVTKAPASPPGKDECSIDLNMANAIDVVPLDDDMSACHKPDHLPTGGKVACPSPDRVGRNFSYTASA
ncbi:MAG: hypothetical protein ACRYG8_39455 [Janthinobacterium lividum]